MGAITSKRPKHPILLGSNCFCNDFARARVTLKSVLTIYKRRHDADCLKALASKGITDKAALLAYRGRDCRCAFWVRGTNDHGKFIPPQSLKARTLEAATAKVKELNKADTNDVGISLLKAQQSWLAELRLRSLSPDSIRQYELTVDLLRTWGERQKPPVTELTRVTPDMINQLRAEWLSKNCAPNTHRNRLAWLSGFFKYAHRMGWINDVPTLRVAPVRKSRPTDETRDEATLPLDLEGDDNYRKILAAIPLYLTGKIGKNNPRIRTSPIGSRPAHLVALAELMYETGLRVSDAVHFRVDDMRMDEDGGVYTTRQIKTGHEVTVYPPRWLAVKLRKLERLSPKYIFLDAEGSKVWKSYILRNVNAYLHGAGEAVGIPGVRPHRFRDSFAVNRLNEGLLLEDVQRLLGHRSLATTERYYNPFVKSRVDRLKERVVAARAEKPKLVQMPKRQAR